MARTYVRIDPAGEEPQRLLDHAEHVCEPWGGARAGERCDKCGGSGETEWECDSCVAAGSDPDCPACHGRVRWGDRCPVCLGSGVVDGAERHGVSVFPRVEGLLRYMRRRGDDIASDVVVAVEGEPSGDVDFDADEGALLICPTRIVEARPVAPLLER